MRPRAWLEKGVLLRIQAKTGLCKVLEPVDWNTQEQ